MAGVTAAHRFALGLLVSLVMLFSVAGTRPAQAQIGSERYASLVIDAQTGQVISATNPDDYRFPASLTKMMTMYLVFEAIRDHRLSFTDQVPVSNWASSMPPTKIGLVPGTVITIEQALLSLVTKSANDSATALGELLGGDEERFAEIMTLRARSLGMSRTTFRNASGLPDWGQVTTARDMAVLARHLLQDFPQFYHYFSTPSFRFHGRVVLNHQTLLRTYPGADGLKTGYTEASGFNVVTSAMRGDVRLIGVVLGAASGGERDGHMAALLDQGFQREGVAPMYVAHPSPLDRLPLIGSARAAPMPAMAREPPARPYRAGPSTGRRGSALTRPARPSAAPAIIHAPRGSAISRATPQPGQPRATVSRSRPGPRAAGVSSKMRYRAAAKTPRSSRAARAHSNSRVAAKASKASRVATKGHGKSRIAGSKGTKAGSTRTVQGGSAADPNG